ncbi:hypothetical protein [Wolbachia endosymbiont (group A) of Apoderus coryli]|nr:hypothetical protein [Wolbachia endosymbiont (group A) of Apoderus coryli]
MMVSSCCSFLVIPLTSSGMTSLSSFHHKPSYRRGISSANKAG